MHVIFQVEHTIFFKFTFTLCLILRVEWALSIRETSDSVARSDRLSKYPVASKLRLVRDRKICVTDGVQLRIRENMVGDRGERRLVRAER